MKDIRGREIYAGDHILYIRSVYDRNFEEGIVFEGKDDYIKVEYMGAGNGISAAKTRKGRVTATTKKVIILGNPPTDSEQLEIFDKERISFKLEVKKLKNKLDKASKIELDLLSQIADLEAEANRVRNRWDILDLSDHE